MASMTEPAARGSQVWVVEVNRLGVAGMSYVYHDEVSARKKYREVQKKYRGTNATYRMILPRKD